MSSATANFPSSMAVMFLSVVPARANGVRTPATIATRRPGPPSDGIGGNWLTFVSMQAHSTPPPDRLAALGGRAFDLLVVGGGITGCGIARDAALRGLSVALVEKDDFASGTSSRSSRLIHGGVRYLEHGHLHLVFESSAQRHRLLRLAPHLVRPLPFRWPVDA